jgi:hypothetical protein
MRSMKGILLLLVCLALQACAVFKPLPVATDLQAGDAEVVVIGKIELVPPLNPELEQRTHWNVVGEKRMLDHVFIATGGEYRPVTTSRHDRADFQNTLEVAWGAPFIVKAPRRRTFLNGGVAYLNAMQQERLWLPGGYYFDVPNDAAAVYIGTLRYFRNDFNTITRVEIVDERKDIASVLMTGASSSKVRPSLLQRVR